MAAAFPIYDIDLYSDDVHRDPHPHFKTMRDLGPVVWLPRLNAWAVPRYKEAREVLRNTEVFVSGQGISLNDEFNALHKGALVTSDGELHHKLRRIIGGPMLPGSLAALQDEVQATADALIERLRQRQDFDAVPDLAHHIPLTLVREFVGLSDEGREHMLEWAAAGFDALGPRNERCLAGMERVGEAVAYIGQCVALRAVRPGSWGDGIFKAYDRGDIDLKQCHSLLMDYIFPALDTTINATSTLVLNFARSPEQYVLLRDDPSLIPNAIDEAVRIESPGRQFSRYVNRDFELEGVMLKRGDRVLTMYSSGNRDERKWDQPDRFDITRTNLRDHIGFGHGVHQCAGMHLAKLEITCLLKALLPRVARIELTGAPTFGINNVIRGLSSLPVRFS